MGSVDLIDQRLRLNNIVRKEQKKSTIIYSYTVDHSIDNAYALYLWLMDKRGIIKLDTCLEFRRNISVSLTNPNRGGRNKKEDNNEKVIIDEKEHLLLPLNVVVMYANCIFANKDHVMLFFIAWAVQKNS